MLRLGFGGDRLRRFFGALPRAGLDAMDSLRGEMAGQLPRLDAARFDQMDPGHPAGQHAVEQAMGRMPHQEERGRQRPEPRHCSLSSANR